MPGSTDRPRADRPRRRTAVSLLGLIVLMAPLLGASTSAAPRGAPPKLHEFMWGLAQQESGGNYYARNRSSGAYGKYQIMPRNWPNWAQQYIGDRRAKQTPRNQERVARAKIAALYRWLDEWPTVAHWWLTGSKERDPEKWSEYSSRYVRNVMALMRRAPNNLPLPIPKPRPDPEPPKPPRHDPDPRPEANVRWTTGSLWIRRGPGLHYRIFSVVLKGRRLEIIGRRMSVNDKPWYKIRLRNGGVGWVGAYYTTARRPNAGLR